MKRREFSATSLSLQFCGVKQHKSYDHSIKLRLLLHLVTQARSLPIEVSLDLSLSRKQIRSWNP